MDLTPHTPETTRLLQDLLRIDTTNPPGNETPCIDFIARTLAGEGIESTVIESAPGRGNLVARLTGDGTLPPILLSATSMSFRRRPTNGSGRRSVATCMTASFGVAAPPT
ncbi:MAG: hypothetical protein IPO29_14470 [Anaerolineae bacterium]|nr:hypothetical protein [Anaerolineae bacterium]